jgi:hypothetical protein
LLLEPRNCLFEAVFRFLNTAVSFAFDDELDGNPVISRSLKTNLTWESSFISGIIGAS